MVLAHRHDCGWGVAFVAFFCMAAWGQAGWRVDAGDRVAFDDTPPAARTMYIAPGGSDQNAGDREHPFATLERARDEARALRACGALNGGSAVIEIAGGAYVVSSTFALGPDDSGTPASPVIYRVAPGSECVFSGGVKLTGFAPITDAAARERLPEEARDKVVAVALDAFGIHDLPPLVLGGFSSGNGFVTHPVMELFFNGEALPMARYPNEGMLHVADIAVADGHSIMGISGSKVGRVLVDDPHLARWAGESNGMLYGYWFFDWADSYERIGSVTPETREIAFLEPYHGYGYRKGARFFAVNMLCEVDAPGEWYLDRSGNTLYLYPPSDPAAADIALSRFDGPLLTLENVANVRFEGIAWEMSAGDGILVKDSSNCLFAGCAVRRCGGNGISVSGGAGNAVVSCDVFSMGRGGVRVSGGNRKTLEPGGHIIANCHIHHLSRIDHTYTPAAALDGVGNASLHNVMHHINSSAVHVNGNDHLVAYCEIHDALLESDDQGGADMWGNPTFRGNVFRYNYWHHLGNWNTQSEQLACGQAGIRLDDAISGTLIQGNVFYRCAAGGLGFGGVQIHGGKDNIVENNLFADCAAAISFSAWGEDRWKNFVAKAMDAPEIDPALYLARYPELAALSDNANANTVRKNLIWKCGKFLLRDSGKNAVEDNAITEDAAVFPGAEQGDFQLPESAVSAAPPGFAPIPFKEIGCYTDRFRATLPEKETGTLRVVTYNIHHGEGLDGKLDLDRIVEILRAAHPDIVCLQEVDRNLPRTQHLDFPNLLSEKLGMPCIFEPNFQFDGGDYGNATLTRFEIVSHENIPLPTPPGIEPRGCLRVTVNLGAGTMDILNTHLGLKEDERIAQTAAIAGALHDVPTILAGDMNETSEGPAIAMLLTRLADTAKGRAAENAFTIPAENPRKKIDFIFASTPFETVLSEIVTTPLTGIASDHLPCVAEVKGN